MGSNILSLVSFVSGTCRADKYSWGESSRSIPGKNRQQVFLGEIVVTRAVSHSLTLSLALFHSRSLPLSLAQTRSRILSLSLSLSLSRY